MSIAPQPGFIFQTTPNILSRPGASAEIGDILARLGVTRALVVTDVGVRRLGLAEPALSSLAAAGIEAIVFDEVVADPPEAVVLAAVDLAGSNAVDGVVGLGGGSSLDVAKVVAYLMQGGQNLADIYGVGLCTGARLPLVQVPTTAGTGSEVTPIAIITTGGTTKKGVVSPQLLPDWAILDADLTLGLPPAVTAATGIDAMVHAIEATTSRHRKNPLSDALAREALRLLAGNIHAACEPGENRAAREAMLLGSMLAGMAFANAPVAAVHALAYPIGGRFKVPHGLSNAMVLTPVLRFNAEVPEAARVYDELAPIVFPDLAAFAAKGDLARRFIDRLEQLPEELGLDVSLQSAGINHNHLPLLAEDAMLQTRLLVNNPREVTEADARAIYEAALSRTAA